MGRGPRAPAGFAEVPFFGPRRGALALAGMPKAPSAGREGFATHLGRILARRGVVVMDRGMLRKLGLVDTVVLDEAALRTGRTELTDLAPVSGADPQELVEPAYALFDPADPGQVVQANGWRLGPLDRLDLQGTTGARARQRMLERGADDVLGLARGHRPRAVVGISAQHEHGVQAIAAAARRSGVRVVLAGGEDAAGPRFALVDDVLPGGDRLAATVRQLQDGGAVVLLLSGDRRGLGAADCGIGVHRGRRHHDRDRPERRAVPPAAGRRGSGRARRSADPAGRAGTGLAFGRFGGRRYRVGSAGLVGDGGAGGWAGGGHQ